MSQTPAILDYETPKAPALGQKTLRGFVWMGGQTILSKALSVGGQVVLAWLLQPSAFGLVALAYAVASFPSLLRDAGLQAILVQRHNHFRRWAQPVFWMSLVLGIVSGLVLVVAAPIASRVMKEPGLTGLILLMALNSPLVALSTVPAAKVQADLRFRFQAVLALIISTSMLGFSIILAWLHFGAYSFIIPYVATQGLRTAILWIAAPTPIKSNWRMRRWKYLTSDSGTIFLASTFGMIVAQGDYLTLGYLTNPVVVGIFYFAFNLSMQTFALLTMNLGGILFPAMSKLQNEPKRQMDGFFKATRTFALLCVPLCFLQAALSDPGLRLLFNAKWWDAISILQVLSIAMAFRTALLPAISLSAAQGRFKLQLIAAVVNAVVFLAVVAPCATLGGSHAGLTVAFGELAFFMLSDSAFYYLMLRINGRRIVELRDVLTTPLILSTVALAAAVGADLAYAHHLSSARSVQLLRITVITAAFAMVYLAGLEVFAPSVSLSKWIAGRRKKQLASI